MTLIWFQYSTKRSLHTCEIWREKTSKMYTCLTSVQAHVARCHNWGFHFWVGGAEPPCISFYNIYLEADFTRVHFSMFCLNILRASTARFLRSIESMRMLWEAINGASVLWLINGRPMYDILQQPTGRWFHTCMNISGKARLRQLPFKYSSIYRRNVCLNRVLVQLPYILVDGHTPCSTWWSNATNFTTHTTVGPTYLYLGCSTSPFATFHFISFFFQISMSFYVKLYVTIQDYLRSRTHI